MPYIGHLEKCCVYRSATAPAAIRLMVGGAGFEPANKPIIPFLQSAQPKVKAKILAHQGLSRHQRESFRRESRRLVQLHEDNLIPP